MSIEKENASTTLRNSWRIMKQAIGYTLLIVGTFALVGSLAVTLVTDYPVTTGIFAAVVLGTVLLEKR